MTLSPADRRRILAIALTHHLRDARRSWPKYSPDPAMLADQRLALKIGVAFWWRVFQMAGYGPQAKRKRR